MRRKCCLGNTAVYCAVLCFALLCFAAQVLSPGALGCALRCVSRGWQCPLDVHSASMVWEVAAVVLREARACSVF